MIYNQLQMDSELLLAVFRPHTGMYKRVHKLSDQWNMYMHILIAMA